MVQVPGCKTNFYYFIGAMAVLSILGSTSRVGNVLVALRCVEVRDKALSFAIQVSQWSTGVLRNFAVISQLTIFHLLVESAMVVLRIFCFQQFFRKILLTPL